MGGTPGCGTVDTKKKFQFHFLLLLLFQIPILGSRLSHGIKDTFLNGKGGIPSWPGPVTQDQEPANDTCNMDETAVYIYLCFGSDAPQILLLLYFLKYI